VIDLRTLEANQGEEAEPMPDPIVARILQFPGYASIGDVAKYDKLRQEVVPLRVRGPAANGGQVDGLRAGPEDGG
jgi:hypothetical protein